MAKPRIIIADTDADYIFRLLRKFTEEYFGKVELEIITDREYFASLFSSPQQAALLIVSEELYDGSLQRHNIAHTFLMTEHPTEEEDNGRVHRVYKYPETMAEVYVEIIGKSGNALAGSGAARSGSQLVVVTSAAGGVGKTTVAMGLCAALARNHKKVLYINADRLQNFQHMLENPNPMTLSGGSARLATADDKELFRLVRGTVRQEGFSYVPPFKSAIMSLGLPYNTYLRLAAAAKASGEYDFVVVDADSCFDEDKAKLMHMADKVVLVTNQTLTAVMATNSLVANINGLTGEKYIFLCNGFAKEQPNALEQPHIPLRFAVSEYVEQVERCEQLGSHALAKDKNIQRLSFLII